jgi:hypothetical protein
MSGQRFALIAWNGLCVFLATLYLFSFDKAVVVSLFVVVSCYIGYGARWLTRGGFALSLVAVAVFLGLSVPDKWVSAIRTAPDLLMSQFTNSTTVR